MGQTLPLPTWQTFLPPSRLRKQVGPFQNSDDYWSNASEFMTYFRSFGLLKPINAVLDVGCGCGKIAAPMTEFLNDQSRYEGFDVNEALIDWCTEHISSKFSNFRFRLADLRNSSYNPKGDKSAVAYEFPYSDLSFDFVFAISVFTHVLPVEMEHYLAEIRRVMRRRKRCIFTFFLFNDRTLRNIETGRSDFTFRHGDKIHRVEKRNDPAHAVAYNEDFVRRALDRAGLNLIRSLRGSWSTGAYRRPYQDVLIAVKR